MLGALQDRLGSREHNPFFDDLPGREPARRYLIATTGRAGSTLLCSRIAEDGRLGFPNEFLNESYIAEFDRLFPNPSLTDFERYVSRSFASKEGVFGLKTDWWRFYHARRLGLFASFYEPLDLVVWLKRDDFVAQAVSFALASETQVWHVRGDADEGELAARAGALAFDAAKITAHAENILNQEYYWGQFFATCDAPVVTLTYEDLAQDVDAGVQAIAEAFHLRLPRRDSPPAVRKARSGVADAWRAQFEGERAEFVRFWRRYRGQMTART